MIAEGVDAEVSGVTADSRKVSQGTVFVAIKGGKSDGAGFAFEAVRNGAVAIVSEVPFQRGLGGLRKCGTPAFP